MPKDSGVCFVPPRSAPRRESCLGSTICAIPMPSTSCCAGTTPGSMCNPNYRRSRPPWDTSRWSLPPTSRHRRCSIRSLCRRGEARMERLSIRARSERDERVESRLRRPDRCTPACPAVSPRRGGPYNLTNAHEAIEAMRESAIFLSIGGHFHRGTDLLPTRGASFVVAPALCESPFQFLEIRTDGREINVRRHEKPNRPAFTCTDRMRRAVRPPNDIGQQTRIPSDEGAAHFRAAPVAQFSKNHTSGR